MSAASLRGRLLFGTLAWIAASLIFAGWGIGRLFQDHVTAQFDAELKIHLDQLTAQFGLDAQGRPQAGIRSSDPRLDTPLSGFYWQIDQWVSTGAEAIPAVLRSRSLWDQVLVVPLDHPKPGEIHRHRVEGPQGTMLRAIERSVTIDARVMRLILAADESLMLEPVSRFKGRLWIALGVLGAGLGLAAWMQVRVGLAPLRRMRAALGSVREGSVERMEGVFPSEIMPLVAEFNHVLAQNSEVVERARTQAGNLAHALKTPLSVLANAASAPERRGDELAQLVRTQVDVARKQVDYHLARAKAAAAVRSHRQSTSLAPVIEGLLRTMRRIHAASGLSLDAEPVEHGIAFRGEEHDLQEMLGNLLDNACKWADTRIVVTTTCANGSVVVTVDDDGPGIAPELRATLMHRGARADEAVPGSGLGLAIVGDLARMYGGDLMLGESPQGGLRATLCLPAA